MKATQIKPLIASIQRTNKGVSDPGITYNEAGVTYNDTRYTYGGLYEGDITPVIASVLQVKGKASIFPTPILASSVAFKPPIGIITNVPDTTPVPVGFSIGPGFFMFIT